MNPAPDPFVKLVEDARETFRVADSELQKRQAELAKMRKQHEIELRTFRDQRRKAVSVLRLLDPNSPEAQTLYKAKKKKGSSNGGGTRVGQDTLEAIREFVLQHTADFPGGITPAALRNHRDWPGPSKGATERGVKRLADEGFFRVDRIGYVGERHGKPSAVYKVTTNA